MPKARAAYGHVRKAKVEVDGIKFASPGEAERYLELCIMKLKGIIQDFTLQPSFELQPAFRKCDSCGGVFTEKDTPLIFKKGKCPVCNDRIFITRDVRYIADFKVVYSDGEVAIEDVKGWGGYTTPEFKLKRKLFEFRYPTLSLVLLKRNGKQKVREALLAERGRLK